MSYYGAYGEEFIVEAIGIGIINQFIEVIIFGDAPCAVSVSLEHKVDKCPSTIHSCNRINYNEAKR